METWCGPGQRQGMIAATESSAQLATHYLNDCNGNFLNVFLTFFHGHHDFLKNILGQCWNCSRTTNSKRPAFGQNYYVKIV
jgi:hypothetical protein